MTTPATTALLDFQVYQQAFTAHIRNPKQHPRPAGVSKERMAVYEEIVFTNLFEAVSACFPVAQSVLGKRAWKQLVHQFLAEHSANSPLFRQIPEEFLQFLNTLLANNPTTLPAFFTNLCHYEWVELAASSNNTATPLNLTCFQTKSIDASVREHCIVFAPSLQLVAYDYAVHTISAKHQPRETQATQLAVFRNADDKVQFTVLNTMTFALLHYLNDDGIANDATGKVKPATIEKALLEIASTLAHPEPEVIVDFGLGILESLRSEGLIIGSYQAAE